MNPEYVVKHYTERKRLELTLELAECGCARCAKQHDTIQQLAMDAGKEYNMYSR